MRHYDVTNNVIDVLRQRFYSPFQVFLYSFNVFDENVFDDQNMNLVGYDFIFVFEMV